MGKWPSSSDQNDQNPDGIMTSTFGRDVESVAFAVLLFLAAGIVLFISCFFVTKCLQCYKARQRRLRRKALGEDDDDDDDDDDVDNDVDIDEDEPQTTITNSSPDLVKV
ncbi:uncharacterized protein CELE_T19D2.3 [Caenorhabditis elegans]|uniref:Uncharacterized protein n=1 Tax=Caenorhabditis elegans TaxID=6239 RepID=Q22581_CAEEL|nr:Uncharacterized protein CELE_T19D2.3 [Caenorhabditis elegans]CCD64661.1 Uncharacterized protein CELE_T19D2.3 [Caenorhabditis elegans]|eukprot:NP_508682.1 Uncharacterized protein CELE_T19D2.3 [Caenorhabditis elegans]